MQTLSNIILKEEIKNKKMSIPNEITPGKLMPTTVESININNFISSQHPLINVWLVFSFISIGILSIILYTI